ncbi:luciferase [Longimycelium tulufanense]|uniref:Luciferase n=1 Tax=Longimycelium tulufanense TaxID=907463 RepID=A0A8J3FV82_9PSEU|nr:LLM class flavin-dependent oxidoreductase [Longimycelium tulufanense]GGM49619.1 luciferase [Longimycelium tulufanense]
MRLGVVILPEYPWPEACQIWTAAEELGLHHAWTFDHLSWRSLRDGPWYDSMTTLGAVAAVTSRIRLGTLVVSPNFRHPVPTAKHVMTLDEVSGGRFIFGMGAGAAGADGTALGGTPLEPAERVQRFREFVEFSDVLLRQDTISWRGRCYAAVDVKMVPGCVQRPRVPFAIAAAGPRAMRIAARHGQTWVTIGNADQPGAQPEDTAFAVLAEQLERLQKACSREDRDSARIGKLVNLSRIVADPFDSPERLADLVGRCHELGFTDVLVNYPRTTGVFSGGIAEFERAVSHVLGLMDRPDPATTS